ncbi:uncharacterized protein LOC143428911 [Xylocopa sonorina]|uniref:uncharacterized protein LOC143428911 n=1 Tax=Xylocopa sonorina TaxID=1818115 RepID=UPI00403AFF07
MSILQLTVIVEYILVYIFLNWCKLKFAFTETDEVLKIPNLHCFQTCVSLDDLDEKLFVDEVNATQLEIQQQSTVSNQTKRFPWHWKHSLLISSEEDTRIRKVRSSSLEISKRGSVCSNQNSPIRSSPKRSKEYSKRNVFEINEDYLKLNPKTKKEYKENADLDHGESKFDSGSHLYSVLEEQFLGEMVHESTESLYSDGNKSIGFHTAATLSTNTWY